VVAAVADRANVCPGETIAGQNFTHSSGTGDFSWEITNPAVIGDATPVSGNGNLPSFTVANNLTGAIVESYVRFFSTRNSCVSKADSFKISVKPAPVITNSNIVFCDNDVVNITFSNNTSTLNSSGNVTYFWTNSNTSIGVNNAAGTSTDKITNAGFPANSGTGTTDNVTTIEVYAEIDGCVGPATTFEVRVKPLPTYTTPDAEFTKVSCSGDSFNFSPQVDVLGTTFNWNLLSNPGGISGATASGNDDISLTLINNTNTIQTVTYQVNTANESCVGETKTLTIDVYPQIDLAPLAAERVVCSDSEFQINLGTANNISIAGEDVIYEWSVSTNNVGAVGGSGTELIETLINNKTTGERDTVIYTITPTLNSGLCLGNPESITVIVNPEAIVFAGNDTTVCEGNQVLLEAAISKGASSGSWSGGSGTFNNRNSLSTFYTPADAEIGSTITFTFTSNDPDGSFGPCTAISDQVAVFIDELPTALILDNPFATGEYCVRDSRLELKGSNINYSSPGIAFTGAGVVYDNIEQKYFFDPEIASVGGPYNIIYRVTNNNGCINSDTVSVRVTNGLSASFIVDAQAVGNGSDYIVCFNEVVELIAGNTDVTGEFSGPGVEFNIKGTPIFNANAAGASDTNNITFTIEDPATGCISESTRTIFRIPKPVFAITSTKVCGEEYAVKVADLTPYDYANDSITSISFEVLNSINQFTANQDTLVFGSPGDKTIRVTWEFELGCTYSQDFEVRVGNIESFDFNISNIKVTNVGSTGTLFDAVTDAQNISIDSYEWSFGDGATDVTTEDTVRHNYSQAGTYEVSMTIIDEYGCEKTTSRTINIVPAISAVDFPYYEDFESNDGGWFTSVVTLNPGDATESSWIYNDNNSDFDNENNNSTYWKTEVNGSAGYRDNERSYLVGPTFDLESLTNPIISFDMYLDFGNNDNYSGAVVEYTVGNNTWIVLGDQNDELNWYSGETRDAIGIIDTSNNNNENISAWTDFNTSVTEVKWNWLRVAHRLDELLSTSNITFRITFNSDNYEEGTLGMAIDNFYVGENPNIILLENFTSFENQTDYLNQLAEQQRITTELPVNMIPLEYHIATPQGDSIYARYPVGLNTRATTYNIQQAPSFILDGQTRLLNKGEINEDVESNDRLIERNSLLAPDTLMTIAVDNTANENTVKFNSSIIISDKYSDRELIAYYFIVEKSLAINISGNNYDITNVVRKALPAVTGERIDMSNNVFDNTYEWSVNNIYLGSELAIVGIIQDALTNEIIQTKYVSIDEVKINVTVLNTISQLELSQVDVYPVPTRDELHLSFPELLRKDVQYIIIDNSGKIIQEGTIKAGNSQYQTSLAQQAPGLYHLILKTDDGKLSRKKIAVKY
jgi:hypothetical protein